MRRASTLLVCSECGLEPFMSIHDAEEGAPRKYALRTPGDGFLVAMADHVHELSRYAFDELGTSSVAHRYRFDRH